MERKIIDFWKKSTLSLKLCVCSVILLTAPILSAMDDQRLTIERLEPTKRAGQMISLFNMIFPRMSIPEEIHSPSDRTVDVVIYNDEFIKNRPVAFVSHYNRTLSCAKALPDINLSKKYLRKHYPHLKNLLHDHDKKCTVKTVKHIGITPELQRRGFGTKLMDHVEKQAIAEGCDFISVESEERPQSFYEKMRYICTNTSSRRMTKPLAENNPDASMMVHATRDMRRYDNNYTGII